MIKVHNIQKTIKKLGGLGDPRMKDLFKFENIIKKVISKSGFKILFFTKAKTILRL